MKKATFQFWIMGSLFLFVGCGGLFTPKEELILEKWIIEKHFYDGKFVFPAGELQLSECVGTCVGVMVYEGDSLYLEWELSSDSKRLILTDSTERFDGSWDVKRLSGTDLRLQREIDAGKEELECISD